MLLSDLIQDQVLQNELHAALAVREISDQESLALAVRSLERAAVLGEGQLAEAQRITAVLATMAGDYRYAETLILKARSYFAQRYAVATILCDITKIEIALAISSTTDAERELEQLEKQIAPGVHGISEMLAQIIMLRCKLLRAIVLQHKGLYKESIEIIDHVSTQADAHRLRNISTECLLLLGDAYLHLLDYDGTGRAYTKALLQARQFNLKIMESWALLRCGDLSLQQGRQDEATSYFQQLRELSILHRIRRFREHSILRESCKQFLQQNLLHAQELLFPIVDSESHEVRIRGKILLGKISEWLSDHTKATTYFRSSLSESLEAERRDLITASYRALLSSKEVSHAISQHFSERESIRPNDLLYATDLALAELLQAPLPTLKAASLESVDSEPTPREYEAAQELIQEPSGQEYLHDQFDTVLAEHYPSLSITERRVCRLIRAGLSSKQIASLLAISKRTVDAHREHIIQKLGIRGQSLRSLLRSIH